jgi:hypothetical protein
MRFSKLPYWTLEPSEFRPNQRTLHQDALKRIEASIDALIRTLKASRSWNFERTQMSQTDYVSASKRC